MLAVIASILIASVPNGNDTVQIFINRIAPSKPVVKNASPSIAAKLTSDKDLHEIGKSFNRLNEEIYCNSDEDTLNMDISMDPRRKKIVVHKISEYEESGEVDSLIKYSSRIVKKLNSKNQIKIRYVINCKEFESSSVRKIQEEILDLKSNDSVKLVSPEYWCFDERKNTTRSLATGIDCENLPKINNIYVRASKNIDLALFKKEVLQQISDSIGVKHTGFAACTEVEGLLVAYKLGEEKVFQFDACNSIIKYKNRKNSAVAISGMSSWSLLVNISEYNHYGLADFKKEFTKGHQ